VRHRRAVIMTSCLTQLRPAAAAGRSFPVGVPSYRAAYAPELNACEGVWASTKNGLGNLAACTADQLAAVVRIRLKRIQHRPALIDGFLPRPDSALNPSRRDLRPRPFNLCS